MPRDWSPPWISVSPHVAGATAASHRPVSCGSSIRLPASSPPPPSSRSDPHGRPFQSPHDRGVLAHVQIRRSFRASQLTSVLREPAGALPGGQESGPAESRKLVTASDLHLARGPLPGGQSDRLECQEFPFRRTTLVG